MQRFLTILLVLVSITLFAYLAVVSSLFIGEWVPINKELVQATVTSKRTHFGGTEDDHFIMYMRVKDSVYKYHDVGKEVYGKYNIGDTLPVYLVTYENSVFRFTFRDIKLSKMPTRFVGNLR